MTHTTWNLFLDDERLPTSDLGLVDLAIDCEQAKQLVAVYGAPTLMSLDHDLGADVQGQVKPSAMAFLTWLIDQHLDGLINLGQVERVIIHSRNTAGVANLAGLWNSFAASCDFKVCAEIRPRATLID